MNRLHSAILAGGLLLSPVLITAEELIRTTVESGYVENESDRLADAASHLNAVGAHLPMWHAAAYLNLAYLFAWALALLAITLVIARARPLLGAASGLLGLVSVIGIAFHWALYYLPIASLAQISDRAMAARAASTQGDDQLLVIALLMYLAGTLLAVLAAGCGLWRAHALPWWGAAGLLVWLGYVFTGPEASFAAVLNLALLLPFVGVARQLFPAADKLSKLESTLT
jgi:hypothetical protein